MAKILGLRFWIFWSAYLASAGILFMPVVFGNHWVSARIIAIAVYTIIALLLWKPVWRWLWKQPRIGSILSNKVFPDLNGDWEMEIRSNWPTIDAMRNAAMDSNASRINVVREGESLPPSSIAKFKAHIDQGWSKICVDVEKNDATPLRRSRTLSVELLPAEADQPKRVAWVFRQENSSPAHTDEQAFYGAAILQVSADANTLEGYYWNNRQWHKGLNVAGEIIMRRILNPA